MTGRVHNLILGCREMWTAGTEGWLLPQMFCSFTQLGHLVHPLLSWPLMNHQTWAFLLRIGNIYYFPGRTVLGCWTAIKQEGREVSFSSKPAYSSAFGTHRLMLCIRLGRAACHGWQGRLRFSLALMSRQTDEWDCLGTTSTLINQAPPFWIIQCFCTPKEMEREKGEKTWPRGKKQNRKKTKQWEAKMKVANGSRVRRWVTAREEDCPKVEKCMRWRDGGRLRPGDKTWWFEVLYDFDHSYHDFS